MVGFVFDHRQDPREIIVEAPDTEATIQQIYNAAREWEASPTGSLFPRIFDGAGKQVLTATKTVGITATMRDWKIRFADRAGPTWTHCTITGGNLVYYNTSTQQYGNPLADIQGQYTTVQLEFDVSAALVNDDYILAMYRLVRNKLTIDEDNSKLQLWNDAGTSVITEWSLTDKDASAIVLQGTGPANRGVPTDI